MLIYQDLDLFVYDGLSELLVPVEACFYVTPTTCEVEGFKTPRKLTAAESDLIQAQLELYAFKHHQRLLDDSLHCYPDVDR